jgi:hypothetical protein
VSGAILAPFFLVEKLMRRSALAAVWFACLALPAFSADPEAAPSDGLVTEVVPGFQRIDGSKAVATPARFVELEEKLKTTTKVSDLSKLIGKPQIVMPAGNGIDSMMYVIADPESGNERVLLLFVDKKRNILDHQMHDRVR